MADGQRQATILAAQGEAAAILAKAEATARGIDLLAEAIRRGGGKEAVGLRIAEQYVEAFGQIAQKGNTMLLPSNASDPSSMIAQAMAIYGQVLNRTGATSGDADRSREDDEERTQMLEAGASGSAGRSPSSFGASPQGPPSYFSAASNQLPSTLFPAPPSTRPMGVIEQRKS